MGLMADAASGPIRGEPGAGRDKSEASLTPARFDHNGGAESRGTTRDDGAGEGCRRLRLLRTEQQAANIPPHHRTPREVGTFPIFCLFLGHGGPIPQG